MRAIIWTTIITFTALGMLGFVAILMAVSFTRSQRARYPVLRRLDGKQLHLMAAATVLSIVAYGAYTVRDLLVVTRSFETIDLGAGDRAKATTVAFQEELSNAARHAIDEASAHFVAGDRLSLDKKFRDAAREYELSANALSTKSALLNVALMHGALGDYKRSREAVLTGISLPANRSNRRLDANLWLELGGVDQGLALDDEAFAALDRAERLFALDNDRKGLAGVSINRGALLSKSDPKRSEQETANALTLYRHLHDREGEVHFLALLTPVITAVTSVAHCRTSLLHS